MNVSARLVTGGHALILAGMALCLGLAPLTDLSWGVFAAAAAQAVVLAASAASARRGGKEEAPPQGAAALPLLAFATLFVLDMPPSREAVSGHLVAFAALLGPAALLLVAGLAPLAASLRRGWRLACLAVAGLLLAECLCMVLNPWRWPDATFEVYTPMARGADYAVPVLSGPGLTDFRGLAVQPDGDAKVLVLGGSAAWGHGVAARQCLAARLTELVPGHTFYTFAAPGLTAKHELLLLARLLDTVQADTVLSLSGWNDMTLYSPHDQPGDIWRKRFERLAIGNPLFYWAASKSSLVRRLLAGDMNDDALIAIQEDDPARLGAKWAAFIENQKAMRDICRARGVRYLFVLQPCVPLLYSRGQALVAFPGSRFVPHWGNAAQAREKFGQAFADGDDWPLFDFGRQAFAQSGLAPAQAFLDPSVHMTALSIDMLARALAREAFSPPQAPQ